MSIMNHVVVFLEGYAVAPAILFGALGMAGGGPVGALGGAAMGAVLGIGVGAVIVPIGGDKDLKAVTSCEQKYPYETVGKGLPVDLSKADFTLIRSDENDQKKKCLWEAERPDGTKVVFAYPVRAQSDKSKMIEAMIASKAEEEKYHHQDNNFCQVIGNKTLGKHFAGSTVEYFVQQDPSFSAEKKCVLRNNKKDAGESLSVSKLSFNEACGKIIQSSKSLPNSGKKAESFYAQRDGNAYICHATYADGSKVEMPIEGLYSLELYRLEFREALGLNKEERSFPGSPELAVKMK